MYRLIVLKRQRVKLDRNSIKITKHHIYSFRNSFHSPREIKPDKSEREIFLKRLLNKNKNYT